MDKAPKGLMRIWDPWSTMMPMRQQKIQLGKMRLSAQFHSKGQREDESKMKKEERRQCHPRCLAARRVSGGFGWYVDL